MDTDAVATGTAALGVAIEAVRVGTSGDVDDGVCMFGNKLDKTALCNTCVDTEAGARGCGKDATRTPGVLLAVAAGRTLVGGVDKVVSDGFVGTPFDVAEVV